MLMLIPGPVSTRPEVRAAMAQDIAPWDASFRPLCAGVHERVLVLAGGRLDEHAVLPLQGCGHFAVEAAIRTFVPPEGALLIPMTGSYAERMARLARETGRHVVELDTSPVLPVDPHAVAQALGDHPEITHVGLVYSETSSGVVHDPVSIGDVARRAGRRMILDAVSAFGALPIDLASQPEIDAMAFTANKCLEGMPGLSFVVARTDALLAGRGWTKSWSFDLRDVYHCALRDGWGSFRFTPPAQVLAAFQTALKLHDREGGQPARLARYRANATTLYQGMRDIGLRPCLSERAQGPIVVNVHAPEHSEWSLQAFVDCLKSRGFLISNFYNTELPSFRVGCIGNVYPEDIVRFNMAVMLSLKQMNIETQYLEGALPH